MRATRPEIAQPARDALPDTGGGDLGVELQTERVISNCECLIGVEFCLCKMDGLRGKVEGVSMPMKNGKSVFKQWCEPFGRSRIRRSFERRPADLRTLLAGIDTSAESRSHKLCAQANADHWLARRQSFADADDLVVQKWVVALVVNADRAAKNHKKVARLSLSQREMRRGRFDGLDVEAAFPKRRIQ